MLIESKSYFLLKVSLCLKMNLKLKDKFSASSHFGVGRKHYFTTFGQQRTVQTIRLEMLIESIIWNLVLLSRYRNLNKRCDLNSVKNTTRIFRLGSLNLFHLVEYSNILC